MNQSTLEIFGPPSIAEPILEPKESVPEAIPEPEPEPVKLYLGKAVNLHYQGNQLTGIYIDNILIGTYAMVRGYAYCIECKSETCTHSRKAKRIFKKIPKEWYRNKPPQEALC